jgi:hypothetical protein
LHTIDDVKQATVDLQERDDVLALPQVVGRPQPVDRAIHRSFEQDRSEHARTSEPGALDHPRAHLVDEVEHLLLGRVLALLDPVETERLGSAAAALVEGGDETFTRSDSLELLVVHGRAS